MRTKSYHALLSTALLLAMASGVAAQEFRATVKGQVVDSSKASLPGATVTIRNQDTNEVATATTNTDGNYTIPFLRPGTYTLSVEMNGGQNRNNEFLLDGAPNNANQGGNNIAYVPPADAVQEFKMQTNSYDAQYGRTAGGVMNMSLKSGTNSFHGTVYEYYRRKWLDA